MSLGPWQLIIIALVILVLFGRGRISEMMGDFGKGIKSFKQGMSEEDKAPAERPRIEAAGQDAQSSEQAAAAPEGQPQPRTPPPDTRRWRCARQGDGSPRYAASHRISALVSML